MTQPRLVGGRYELGELIGYGGMAEVHRGRDVRLGREVAIKVLRADLARDPSFLARFRREAQSAAGLNHPSIVSVYDTGEDPGPDGSVAPYIVMEYVAGRTLRDVVKSEGTLPPRRVMEIGAEICGALDFSHRSGIVHRDIKPANVMITPTGAVKVMDFGIARAIADNSATVTQTANIIGTAQYLSPEQARGEAVDARSDVYSTGCLLYELAAGSPPFQGDSPVAVAYQQVREAATAPSTRNPKIPAALDSIVMKALAKNQLNRYQSAGEMRVDLQRALANQPVSAEAVMSDADRTQFIARTPALVPRVPRGGSEDPIDADHHGRRNGLVWLAIVAAMLLVIGGIVALVAFTGGNSPSANQDGPTATVPANVLGMDVARAEAAFAAAGITFQPANPPTSPGPCDGTPAPALDSICTLRVGNQKVAPGDVVQKSATVVYTRYLPMVAVPDLYGLTADAATAALTTLKFAPVADGTTDGACTDNRKQVLGKVCTQSQAAGISLPVGQQVRFETYAPKSVDVPTVQGLSYAEAANLLTAQKFKVHQAAKPDHTNQPAGTVTQQNPAAGSAAAEGAIITLTVSDGQVILPAVSGLSAAQAQKTLNQAGFTTTPISSTSTPTADKAKDGTVASVSPTAGLPYPTSTVITLTLYSFQPTSTSCSPTSTGTPTDTTTPGTPGPGGC